MTRKILGALLATAALCACTTTEPASPRATPAQSTQTAAKLPEIVDGYLRLTLEAGTHEAEWVDAYYGPGETRASADANPRSIAALLTDAKAMIANLDQSTFAPTDMRRAKALRGMLIAAETRLQMLQGR